MKRKLFLSLIALLFIIPLHAQIGVNTAKIMKFALLEVRNDTINYGGVLMPRLSSEQRDSLSIRFASDWGDGLPAAGLMVYNTDENCNEYWNGTEWISVCSGTAIADIKLVYSTPPLSLDMNFNTDGSDANPNGHTLASQKDLEVITASGAPVCSDGYIFSIVAGASFTSISNETDYQFTLMMQPNTLAKNRTAIIRVSDKCTGGSVDYIFTQFHDSICPNEPDGNSYSNLEKPIVMGNNGNSSPINLCSEGAVMLYVSNADTLDTNTPNYIWTLNGAFVSSGVSYTATLPGTYIVYVDAIGCTDFASDPFVVTFDRNSVADPAIVLTETNHGVMCDAGGSINPVVITATGQTNTIYWYRNGIYLNGLDGYPSITLDKLTDVGIYTATSGDGNCSSVPSNEINVSYRIGTPIAFDSTNAFINGFDLSSAPSFCSSGLLHLTINPVINGVRYIWYMNGSEIATGTNEYYTIPSAQLPSSVSITVVATNPGDANSCAVSISPPSTNVIQTLVTKPVILGDAFICGNNPDGTDLLATDGSGTDYDGRSFRWIDISTNPVTYYPDTGFYPGPTFTPKTPGNYVVQAYTDTSGMGCMGQSDPFAITLRGTPALEFTTVFAKYPTDGTALIFQVQNTAAAPAKSYRWWVTPASAVATQPTSNTNQASIVFQDFSDGDTNIDPTGRTAVVHVSATGDCGTSSILTANVASANPSLPVTIVYANGYSDSSTCGGVRYTIDPTCLASYAVDPDYKIRWHVNDDLGGGPGKETSGAHNEFCFLRYPAANSQYYIRATATVDGTNVPSSKVPSGIPEYPVIDVTTGNAQTPLGGPNNITASIAGQNCFDVRLDKSAIDFADRVQDDLVNNTYVYSITGDTPDANSVVWSVSDANGGDKTLIASLTNDGSASTTVQYDPTLITNGTSSKLYGDIFGHTVTLMANFTVGGCAANKTFKITIQDAGCCSYVKDVEGNIYRTAMFGDAGCWMTENLYSTTYQGTALEPIQNATYISDPKHYYKNAYTYVNNISSKAAGLYYTPSAIFGLNTGGITNTLPSYTQSAAGTSSIQGICPEGWVIPSIYDWSSISQEIASNIRAYSTYEVGSGYTNYSALFAPDDTQEVYDLVGVGTNGNKHFSLGPNKGFNALHIGSSLITFENLEGGGIGQITFATTAKAGTSYKPATNNGIVRILFSDKLTYVSSTYTLEAVRPISDSYGFRFYTTIRSSAQMEAVPVRCLKQGTNTKIVY